MFSAVTTKKTPFPRAVISHTQARFAAGAERPNRRAVPRRQDTSWGATEQRDSRAWQPTVSGNLAMQPAAYSHDALQDQVQELSSIIAHIARGDQEAFTALYDATSSVVYGLALRILRDPGAAEDVTIEVYLQVHAQAEHYDARRGTPLGWIITLTRSRAIDRQRKDGLRKQREAPLELTAFPSKEASPEAQSATREQQRIVRTALASLTPKQRQVIEIAYFEGLSHAEIAAKLGQPLGTVKTRFRTGLQALRVLLCPFMGEGEA